MPKISYSEIEYSEKTCRDTTEHLWDWNKDTGVLIHYVDGVFVDEFTGKTALSTLSSLMK